MTAFLLLSILTYHGGVDTLRAGTASSNITPDLGSSLNGGHSDRKALFVHDELHARCLVLDDGRAKLAIVVCDSCMVPREVVLDAKQRIEQSLGIPPSHVLISATHSHSTPTCAGVFQSDTVPGYPEFLARRIADGVARATNNLAPARLGWSLGSNDRQVFNRRWFMKPGAVPRDPFGQKTDRVRMNPGVLNPDLVEPAGPVDPTVAVLYAMSPEGRPIAALANYSLHYVGDTGPGHVSADYFAAFADALQLGLGVDRPDPPFVGIMSNGSSGDINNVNVRAESPVAPPYTRIRAVAGDLANDTLRLIQGMGFTDGVRLSAASEDIQLDVRKPSAKEVADAKQLLASVESKPLQSLDQIYARETILLADFPDTVPATLQILAIGDLRIGAIPCEVFVEIGLALRAKAADHPYFTVSLANGYNGYLPTRRHHELGGYETWRARFSYLAIDSAERIEAKLVELLSEVDSPAL